MRIAVKLINELSSFIGVEMAEDFFLLLLLKGSAVWRVDSMVFFKTFNREGVIAENTDFIEFSS